jgi:hypothetical protein
MTWHRHGRLLVSLWMIVLTVLPTPVVAQSNSYRDVLLSLDDLIDEGYTVLHDRVTERGIGVVEYAVGYVLPEERRGFDRPYLVLSELVVLIEPGAYVDMDRIPLGLLASVGPQGLAEFMDGPELGDITRWVWSSAPEDDQYLAYEGIAVFFQVGDSVGLVSVSGRPGTVDMAEVLTYAEIMRDRLS